VAGLLRDFGLLRKSDHPEQPFSRLQDDGVWTVTAPADLPLKTGDNIPRVTALRSDDVRARFAPDRSLFLTTLVGNQQQSNFDRRTRCGRTRLVQNRVQIALFIFNPVRMATDAAGAKERFPGNLDLFAK
jgi:hypothetical protein